MPDVQKQFELLAAEFEMVSAKMEVCRDPALRLVLLRRMKVLIDEIFELIASNQTNQQNHLSNPNLNSQDLGSITSRQET
jgi:hypothetical protein